MRLINISFSYNRVLFIRERKDVFFEVPNKEKKKVPKREEEAEEDHLFIIF